MPTSRLFPQLTPELIRSYIDAQIVQLCAPAPQLLLFEKIINLVHRLAPAAKICFNTNPADTAQAVQRWIPPPEPPRSARPG